MDPSFSVGHVLRCDLCDTPVPPLSCDFCHIYLCKACVGEHVLDVSTEHKVVPIQQALTDPVYPRCSNHSSKQCELYCKHCTIPICVECATSKEHQEHRFVDLLKCAESKKEDIREDMNELESSILKEYKEIATGIPSQKAHLHETADILKTSIDKYGEQLYRQVDAFVKKLKSEVDEKEKKEFSVLNKEEEEIAQKISSIEKYIFDKKVLQASMDLGHVSEYKSRNREFRNVPPKHKVSMPTFSPKDISMNQFLEQFGSLSTEESRKVNTSQEEQIRQRRQSLRKQKILNQRRDQLYFAQRKDEPTTRRKPLYYASQVFEKRMSDEEKAPNTDTKLDGAAYPRAKVPFLSEKLNVIHEKSDYTKVGTSLGRPIAISAYETDNSTIVINFFLIKGKIN